MHRRPEEGVKVGHTDIRLKSGPDRMKSAIVLRTARRPQWLQKVTGNGGGTKHVDHCR